LKGKRLKYGDTIGIIMPASPEEDLKIKQHILVLREMGFKVKEGAHIYDKHGYLAGEDSVRAKDLTNMFLDEEVNAIMCYKGGYGTMRILPYIDYNIIRKHPKIFIGYSDITTLLNSFYQKSGLVTFHGPMVGSNLEDINTAESFFSALMLGTSPYNMNTPTEFKEKYYGNCSADGVIVGGNLSLICSLLGTPYEIDTDNKILFIEEVGEAPYRIDRMLTQLVLSGKLQKCCGFILGQFTDCFAANTTSLTVDNILLEKILSLNKPTVTEFMSGHDYPKLTIPIGAKARIDLHNERIEVLESVVKD
jgi:muramoyltetrapeptide carboxypeptidase